MFTRLSSVVALVGLLVPLVLAEPPVQYGVPAFSGHSSFGVSGSGGGYYASDAGYQTNEGLNLDPHLLHKIKGILLEHEAHEEQYRHHSPAPVYGVPHYERVSGIEFGHLRPSLQVAQFHQQAHEYHVADHHGLSQGYALPVHGPSLFRAPAPVYGAPAPVYGPPSGPSPRYHH